MLSTFLLLFFLLPRAPSMWIKSFSNLSIADGGVQWTETFGFQNNNFYGMEWTELETQVYLCDGTIGNTVFFGCVGTGGTTPTQIFQGDYTNPDTELNKFPTGSRSETSLDIVYTSLVPGSGALTTMNNNCNSQGYNVFLTQAEVKGSLTNGHSFGWTHLYTITQVFC
eukprot:CAMPEP_0182453448 /NCGR_PEP_ID=MMETSP1319-20130603/507_1 /TAXON_ID=172717 /ORGANISM="Bolidomonas pacifica, Strain RCC208" /LENGTH=167 /DNA_ID=CAMNT_0024651383 /DNA_START=176 /DNA_END=679 /DNA_ORIENTATION=-